MPPVSNEGRAYIAGWIIKMLAAAFVVALLGWGQYITATTTELTTEMAVQKQAIASFSHTMDRIEVKLDLLLAEKRNAPTK